MNFYIKVLVFSCFVTRLFADNPYNCAGTNTINPPANINDSISYPSTWKTGNNAPQYQAGQNCSWIINVPKRMFAYFQMEANTTQASVLTMTDSTGYITKVKTIGNEPFFLMDPSFRVDLQSNQIGTFGMQIKWMNVKPTFPTTWQVHPNSSPLTLFSGDFDNSTTIQAETKVNLLALPPTLIITDVSSYLRATQIYDGPSINSAHIGNLYQVVYSDRRFISTGKELTLWTVFPGLNIGNSVILQDYSDVKDFKTYRPISCILPLDCEVSLDASQGTAAAIRYNPSGFFVKDITMPQTNKLSVYTDYVTSSHKLADYTSTISKTNTPQKFNGKYTTFVLNQDQATVLMSPDSTKADWTDGFNGRRGFFTSPNYALNSPNQNFDDRIYASSISNISYTVESALISGDATLNIVILSNQKTVVNNTHSIKNFPEAVVWAAGDTITVKYRSNGEYNIGSLVSFGFDKYNSATISGVFISFIVTIWVMISIR